MAPRAAPIRRASCATPGRCERRTWSGRRLSHHHRSRRQTSTGPYLISQAMPSRSRSSSSRYPGSPRYKGAAPASFAFLQLGKYMLSCLGSGTGAGAAAPPPAWLSSSGVDSGSDVGSDSCIRGCNGGCDVGACVVGIGDGVGLGVGDGVGLGVGDGEGVGVGDGDGDGEAVILGDGAGVGEPASSATDGTPHPAIPTPRTRARSTGAEVLSSPRRLDVGEDTDETDERENMGEIGGNMGVVTEASSGEKG